MMWTLLGIAVLRKVIELMTNPRLFLQPLEDKLTLRYGLGLWPFEKRRKEKYFRELLQY